MIIPADAIGLMCRSIFDLKKTEDKRQEVDTSKKRSRAVIIILLVLVVALTSFCVFLLLRSRDGATEIKEDLRKYGDGLFSWHDEIFDAEEREDFFRMMKEQGLTELYQDVPFNKSASSIKELVSECGQNGVRLYLLVGEPEWALDKSAVKLRTEIQRAALMGFSGVMVDVEPGSTDEWKDDRGPVMETMTKMLLRGKAAAEENGIEMIVCLSYYYDDYGFDSELEEIVGNGCDSLAIMNYDRADEIGQIENEAALCKKYGKRLINIYELQEVGKYGLEESHTYREAGLSALKESAEKLIDHYSGMKISTSLHDYRALKAMTE